MSGFTVRLLESAIEGRVRYVSGERSLELRVYAFNLLQTELTTSVQLFKLNLMLSPVLISLFLNILKLNSLTKLAPVHVRINLPQCRRVQIVNEFPQQHNVIFNQVKRQAVSLTRFEILIVLEELVGVIL